MLRVLPFGIIRRSSSVNDRSIGEGPDGQDPIVTVRPLAHMLGEAEFNEMFLDDVFVPDG